MAPQLLQILLYGVLVYDLLDTLQRKLNLPATITRLKENAPPDVLAEHMANAEVVIALHYEYMPPAPKLRLLQVPGAFSFKRVMVAGRLSLRCSVSSKS